MEHFIPRNLETTLQQKEKFTVIYMILLAYVLFFLFVLYKVDNMPVSKLQPWMILDIILFGVCIFRKKIYLPNARKAGIKLDSGSATRVDAWGNEVLVSYETYDREIANGKMKYKKDCIVIGGWYNRIRIDYHIGESKKQKKIKEAYDFLQSKLTVKLLPYENEYCEMFDKENIYCQNNRSFRVLVCMFCIFSFPFLFELSNEADIENAMVYACLSTIFVSIESVCLYRMFCNAVFIHANGKKLEDKLNSIVKLSPLRKYRGVFEFISIFLISIMASVFVILFIK